MSPHFPWASFREPWDLTVETLKLDGTDSPGLLEEEHRRVRTDLVPDWAEISFDVRLTKPAGETGVSVTAAHVLVSSPRTQTRLPVPLRPVGPHWEGEVRIARALVSGTVTIQGELSAPQGERTRLVGRSVEWVLVVDKGEAPAPPGAPPFTMTWVDFASGEAPSSARQNPDVLVVMELVGDAPVLYLNDAIEGFREVVHADYAKNHKRLARDLLGAQIARQATATLVREAVGEVVRGWSEDDEPRPPSDRLQRQGLEAVARTMNGVTDLADLCRRVIDAEQGSLVDRAAFWRDVDAAVDRLCDVPAATSELCKGVRFG